MNRIFIRRKDGIRERDTEGFPLMNFKIAVTGLGRSVGTSFVASSLAFFFAEKGYSLSFTQCGEPERAEALLYDGVSMDKRFIPREFIDVYDLIDKDRTIKPRQNIEEGISWTLITPKNCREKLHLSTEKRARLIHGARGQICIFDMEACDEWNLWLMDMDLLLIVTDPLPSKLIRSAERFGRLKKMELDGLPVRWIVNRMNDGVSRKELRNYLKADRLFYLSHFPPDRIYALEYNARFCWEDEQIRSELHGLFTQITQ